MVEFMRSHPSDLVKDEWRVSRHSIKAGGLVIEKGFATPGEAAATALTHHTLTVQLRQSENTRQMTRLGQQEYDGPNPAGAMMLATANNTPCHWAWNSTNEVIMFVIDPLYLQKMAEELQGTALDPVELKPTPFGIDPQIEGLARQYRTELQSADLGSQLYCESLGDLFLLHLLRQYSYRPLQTRKYGTGLCDRKLKQVLAYIDAHLGQNISLRELAKVAQISQYHFSGLFKQSVGIPPYRYVLLRRIERAKDLLQKERLPINEVALSCGFADQSHLTKHFRRSVGMTPRVFRESF